MPLFSYKVIDKEGRIQSKEGFFDSVLLLEQTAHSAKDTILSYKEIALKRQSVLRKNEALQLLQGLATLLTAGLSLLKSIESLKKGEGGYRLKRALRLLEIYLNQGDDLAQALENLNAYPLYIIDLIRLGLKSSKLPTSLQNAHDLLHAEHKRQKDLRKSMAYPILLLGMMLAMIILFSQFLLPEITSYLQELGINELPLVTRSLVQTSAFLQTYCTGLVFIIGFFVAMGIAFQKICWLQMILTPFLLNVPFWGEFYKRRQQNQWLFYVSHLYSSGMDLKTALDFTAASFQNSFIKKLFQKTHEEIYEGSTLLEALASTAMFSSVALSLLQAGAQTGDIAGACTKAYTIEEERQQQGLSLFLKSLEPALLICMGLMLLWIVLAVITPIYDHLVI